MTSVLRRFDDYWYARAPAERLALLRMAVGGYAFVYLVVRAGAFASVARFRAGAFRPVGLAAVLDEPLPVWAADALLAASVLTGACFVLGFVYRLSAPLFALLLLWVTSYRSSWGMVFHTDNLVTLHVIVLAVSRAADALSLDARKRETSPECHGRYGWPARAVCLVTVVTYVLAGVAKLRASGMDWVTGDVLRVHIAYDNLRKIELGSIHSPLGAAMVPHAWLFPGLAAASMIFELGAPLALLHRKLALFWVLGAWSFHVGVLAIMAIGFAYPLSGVAYLSFFELERVRHSRRLPAFLRAP